jgi:ParB-like chromosome segregation protein Spo0J
MEAPMVAKHQDRPFHPLANLLPMMDEGRLAELAADIREQGLIEPIALDDTGRVLDGRNRLRACKAAGVEPRFVTYTGSDAVAFVLSKNVARRHLTDDQRRMVAAKLVSMRQGNATSQIAKAAVSREQAAAMVNADVPGVDRARVVVKLGTPELVGAVERGQVTVAAAAEIAKKTAREQRAAVKAPPSAAKRGSALPKVAARKPERAPWETVRATQAREARDVGDLDAMLRIFREQLEPVYSRSGPLVRERIKKDVAQGFERMDRSTPAVTERHDD